MSDVDATRGTSEERFRKSFLLLLVIAISALFFAMVRSFLTALLLAAILTGMSHPIYRRLRDSRLLRRLRAKETLASLTTVLFVTLVIILPLLGLATIVVAQAIRIAGQLEPLVRQQLSAPTSLDEWLSRLPFAEMLAPYRDEILGKLGQVAASAGTLLVSTLAATTRSTGVLIFLLFLMLYATFSFLIDGRRLLDRILYYMPLGPGDEDRMVEKFVSVGRATIKGTLVIGLVQGTLGGIGFAFAGIDGAAFWGTIMAVLSIIPGIGTALVWIPAVIYLLATGHLAAGVGLGIWCAAVVGTVDNLLRPRLVGRDTRMPDLLVLLSTVGGLVLFGGLGIIIGPIVAALFVTVWDIYAVAFKEYLPDVTKPG